MTGRRALLPRPGVEYVAFVDMSGGSSDDAVLAIAHRDEASERIVLDRLETQTGRPPFNPRDAIRKFVALLNEYRITCVVGDRYASETFRAEFREADVEYEVSEKTKSQLYEALEPRLNAAEVELLDNAKLAERLDELVLKGGRIDHAAGSHGDLANGAAAAIEQAGRRYEPLQFWGGGKGAPVEVSGR